MDLIEEMTKIDAYLFKYKPEAQQAYQGKYAIDDKEHVGVMAQELESTPLTQAVVNENEDGVKIVDTRQLTLTLTAVCSELAKEVQTLRAEVTEIKNKMGV